MQAQGFPVSVYQHPLLAYGDRVSSSSFSSSSYPFTSTTVTTTRTSRIQSSNHFSIRRRKRRPLTISLSSEQPSDDLIISEADDDDDIEGFDLRGIEITIEKLGNSNNNCRRIRSKVPIDASLHTLWNILTDYERLPDFIPGLALCQLLHKTHNFARLFQIGQQNLAFGLKFKAKGVVDCYEKDLESFPYGQKRDIEFKMIEGDFQLFEGKWSIQENSKGTVEENGSFDTTLSYVVDVKPKMWLPVRLVEGRLCKEIQMNLSCIRKEAQKACRSTLPFH